MQVQITDGIPLEIYKGQFTDKQSNEVIHYNQLRVFEKNLPYDSLKNLKIKANDMAAVMALKIGSPVTIIADLMVQGGKPKLTFVGVK